MTYDPIRDYLIKNLEQKTKLLKAQFAQVQTAAMRTVTENIFKTYFLPYFCGEDTSNKEELLAHWYRIAGTPYCPVGITNPHGDIVAVVPPILDRSVVPLLVDRGHQIDISSMLNIANNQATLSPALATRSLSGMLTERFSSDKADSTDSPLTAQWVALFAYFGKEAITVKTEPVKAAVISDYDYE